MKHLRVSKRMLLTWFILTGFIFLFAPQKLTNKFQFAFARIFRWPLSIGRSVSLSSRAQQLTNIVSRRQFVQLQNYLANVIAQLNQARQKVEKLSAMRNRFGLEGAKLVLADVIIDSINSLHSELIINRGQTDGLDVGQFVLGDNCIIGIISDVSTHTAQVKLVTDSTSKIAVKIAELNVDRLMQGNGNYSAKIKLLPIKHKVKVGDKVYACKKPGGLDVPMIVGTITQRKRDDENPSLWDIMVKPACDIEKLNSVVVLVMNPQ